MAQQQNKVSQDFIARDYQRNIIDVCIKRNSIIFLPTGAGKTYISVQVIKHFSNHLNGKYSEGAKRSIFLVNTVFLAKQQREAINFHLPFNVAVVTGENNVDAFIEQDWVDILDKNEILVMTAQCFKDAVDRTFIKIQQMNVIVFDECHHARKDHVYHQLMQSIATKLDEKEMMHLRIVGLSGMLIGVDNSVKKETVAQEMIQLESTFQSTIITVNNIDDHRNMLLHSTKAKESLVAFRQLSGYSTPLKEVLATLEELQAVLKPLKPDNYNYKNPKNLRETLPPRIKELINMLKDFTFQAEQMGNFGAFLTLMSTLVQLELTKRTADSERYRQIIIMCITKIEKCVAKMKKELFPSIVKDWNRDVVFGNSSDKVQKLMNFLQYFFTEHNTEADYQCIIFVQRRSTAKIMYHVIKILAECMENFPLRPDFVVGYNNELTESIEALLNKSQNAAALEKFNRKETNCIVCTNVLEEGIDIQACNLVIMYDPPMTPRSFIQSRGRARDNNSDYLVMIDDSIKSRTKFQKNMDKWKTVNAEMKKQLIGKTLDRPLPSDEDIQNEQEQAWDPYITPSGSELNALNAINILNQFCMSLPFDRYTKYRECYRRIDHEDGTCQVGITMPISSMIRREIFGERKNHIRLAKQHAAFVACKVLLANGSLTDKLVPISYKEKIEEFNETYFSHWDKYLSDEKKKAGTKNNIRSHIMKIPDAIRDCSPSTNKHNFLYRINIKPEFSAGDDPDLKVFHELIENENTFGILTTKRIPRLCKIPLFQSFGKISCELSPLPTLVEIENESKIEALRRFHVNIFRNVLNVMKEFCTIDKSSYLIVPLNEQHDIDWTIIEQFKEISRPTKLTPNQIRSMTFETDDYMHKVLNPVYRCTDQNYLVVDVLTNKSPLSLFPDQTITFADYYRKREHVIYRNDQFLLQVKGISKNLNLFFPGAGASGENKKTRTLREEYVPELCHNYKFPGDYWLKATLLPSICHRLQYLLNAEELRKWLIKEKIDLGQTEQIYELDIDYGDYEERKEKTEQNEPDILDELKNFKQILQEQRKIEKNIDGSKKDMSSKFRNQKLPIDFDRNFMNVTEADLDSYMYFIGFQEQASSSNRVNKRQTISPPAIKDSKSRADINLIHLTNQSSGIQQKDLIKVLTTSNSGDVYDMERYETLGDAFLKFIASLFLYKTHDNLHEGHLTALKGKMVSNRNLFYVGNEFGLSKIIKSSQFCSGDSLHGLPPSCTIPENIIERVAKDKTLLNRLVDLTLTTDEVQKGTVDENHLNQFLMENSNAFGNYCSNPEAVDKGMLLYLNEASIGDKIIADAVEALIGCVVSSTGPLPAMKLCQKLKIIPENVQNLMTEKILPRTPLILSSESGDSITNVGALEKTLGYKFQNRVYLTQALTHSSYPIKDGGTYENLEFLGDAVLDFLITSYISEQCPKMDPGKLTDLRSALVNNVTLACIVVRKKINKFLKAESRTLYDTIKKFVDFQMAQNNKVTDEVILMNEEEESSSAEAVNVPKVLGDIFESIIGAVFLDSNLCFAKTWSVIYNLMKNEINEFMAKVPLQVVRRLYEHNKGSAKPQFYAMQILEDTQEVAVPLKFKLRGETKFVIGFGKNRKIAKNAAAKRALIYLEKSN